MDLKRVWGISTGAVNSLMFWSISIVLPVKNEMAVLLIGPIQTVDKPVALELHRDTLVVGTVELVLGAIAVGLNCLIGRQNTETSIVEVVFFIINGRASKTKSTSNRMKVVVVA